MITQYQCQYKFDINDISFINAIILYNANATIVEAYPSLPTPFPCSQLLSHLPNHEELSDLQISITCRSNDEISTKNIFPSLSNVDLLQLSGINHTSIEGELLPIRRTLDSIIEELEFDIDADASDVQIINKSINRLTQAQAYLVLEQLKQKYTLQGAMHIPNLQTILFQLRDRNHLLVYGPNSRYIGCAKITFDLNEGFRTSPYLFAELQKFFITWIENKFVGPLIPEDSHGFNLVPPPQPLTIPFLSSLWQMITSQLVRLYNTIHVPRVHFSFFSKNSVPIPMDELQEQERESLKSD